MIHPDTELRYVNPLIGYGVFATRDIPAGTITWARDALDQSFTIDQYRQMEEPYRRILEKYSYLDRHERLVLCWDHARFINHSCDPSCMSPGYDFEIALRDIRAGEELTDDYATLNLNSIFECACASPNCRRRVGPQDRIHHATHWDEQLRLQFPQIAKVAQPLWWVVENSEEVTTAVTDAAQMRTCQWHFVDKKRR